MNAGGQVMQKSFATYQGRVYELVARSTRFGIRAKLRFLDGTKEFWVDESRLSDICDRTHLCNAVGVKNEVVVDPFL
jgi:hypothetical protein